MLHTFIRLIQFSLQVKHENILKFVVVVNWYIVTYFEKSDDTFLKMQW